MTETPHGASIDTADPQRVSLADNPGADVEQSEDRSFRRAVARARRVVVKIGSSSLTSVGDGLDTERIDTLADSLAVRRAHGQQVVLVSSGAIAAGLAPLGLRTRPRDLSHQQAAASVGQTLLVARYASAFSRHDLAVGQVLLTSDDLVHRVRHRNANRTLERLLAMGVLPIVNENDTVATDEIRFGDNDRLAALVVHLLRADALVLLSDVDGLYDQHPRNPGARLVNEVAAPSDLADVETTEPGNSGLGSGGMASKLTAARMASHSGAHVVLTSASQAAAALAGEPVGTYFRPASTGESARLLWLRYATQPRGQLTIDPGAEDALVRHRASLLAAGITRVVGDFVAGDPVDVLNPVGRVVARGMSAYDAAELPRLLGKSTHMLGAAQQREVIHRDDLAVL